MSGAITAAVVVAGGAAYAANQAKGAARDAARSQRRSADAGIAEQQRQFDEVRALLKPYIVSGNGASAAQMAFLGLSDDATNLNDLKTRAADAAANAKFLRDQFTNSPPSTKYNRRARQEVIVRDAEAQAARLQDELKQAQASFNPNAGRDAEQAAVQGVLDSSQYRQGVKEGENAILQNASATGGLRGGNTQNALANFRPNLLNQLIAQRFAQLGDVAARGQASAAGQAELGQQSAGAVAGLLQQQGQIQAGQSLANGAANQQLVGGIAQAAGGLAGYYGNRPQTPQGVVAPAAPAVQPAAPQYGPPPVYNNPNAPLSA